MNYNYSNKYITCQQTRSMLTNNLVIYHDTDVPRWLFDQTQEHYDINAVVQTFVTTQNLDKFVDHLSDNKIACFHVPYPIEETWLKRFWEIYPHCQNIVVLCSEMHQGTVSQLLSIDLPRVTIFISGFIDTNFSSAAVYQWMDFFNLTTYFYTNIKPNILDQELLKNTKIKTKLFDALLGRSKPHRKFVLDYLNSNNLFSKGIVTYFDKVSTALRENSFILETKGLEFYADKPVEWTIDLVNYYGHPVSLSQIIPMEIYNQTYYSIIAETNADNEFNFYTEKTAKPLIAGRIFIAICGVGFLRNLRKLGFKTFHGIIDESYDLVLDHQQRWTMALNQLKILCEKDPKEVYKETKEILDYNQKLILKTDWLLPVKEKLVKFLL